MQYTYSVQYGDRSVLETRKRCRDRHGDEIPRQSEYDAAVDKGLLQAMKEDKLPFNKLLTRLRDEAVKQMHSRDRWREPAYTQLDRYCGVPYACADGTPVAQALRWYWYDHLGVAHDRL